jgi:flavin-binding protein dodecin
MGKTFKVIEMVGTSEEGYDDAIQSAVAEASKTLKGLSLFEFMEMRGGIQNGKVTEYQVILKVGFKLIH